LTQATPKLLENSPLVGHAAAVNALAFNPVHPNILASTSDDKTLLIWNLEAETDNHTAPVLGLNESMEAVAFRPDGKWLASATDNKTVLLWQWDAAHCANQWDAKSCQPTNLGTPLVGHQLPVENVVFLSDTRLVSADASGELILWDLNKADWYERACAIVNRPLSLDETGQYMKGKRDTLLQIFAWLGRTFGKVTQQDMPTCLETDQS
jgi:WD40 repeat protein